MAERVNILDLNIEEIEKMLYDINQSRYRAKQIFQWLHKGVKEFSQMTNLPLALRTQLDGLCRINSLAVRRKLVSQIDGTVKYVMELEDGNLIESVLMSYRHGLSVCISSQVGCRMGCGFCASSGLGFVRNLSPGEMLDQIITAAKDAGKRISNIVVMGIGEPLDNYDNTIKFLRLANDPSGLNIGFRHISVSTCGLVPQILTLAGERMPITLSVSLHAPNDDIRKRIMPITKKYGVDEIVSACREYTRLTGRRVTFEYAMISGVNDSGSNAAELAQKLKGMLCHVNLIPVNEVKGTEYKRSSTRAVKEFIRILKANGIGTTLRRELGRDIEASCGQLRRRLANDETGVVL